VFANSRAFQHSAFRPVDDEGEQSTSLVIGAGAGAGSVSFRSTSGTAATSDEAAIENKSDLKSDMIAQRMCSRLEKKDYAQ
jgi:hypothetical protein